MNFLAHAYLSFSDPGVLTGNMISDFVKGKKQYDYPEMIFNGIKLHRAIDDFTDNHPATRSINRFFQPGYRLYAGAFTDIAYDYFLANDRQQFESEDTLLQFTHHSYQKLQENEDHFPATFRRMFPFMTSQNWLYNYRQESGIYQSFQGLARRAKYIAETETAYAAFLHNKDEIRSLYETFFPLLKNYATALYTELLKTD